jgi:hypothetical protein
MVLKDAGDIMMWEHPSLQVHAPNRCLGYRVQLIVWFVATDVKISGLSVYERNKSCNQKQIYLILKAVLIVEQTKFPCGCSGM